MIGLTWEFNHFLHGDVTVNKWDWPSIYDGFMLVYDYKIDGGYAVERVCKQTFRKLGVAFFFLNLHIWSNSESTFKDLKQVEIRGSPIELGLKDWDPLVMTNKHSHGSHGPFLMGKSTISMGHCPWRTVSHNQRVSFFESSTWLT